VGVTDDPGDAGEGGQFFRGALDVAAGGDDLRVGIDGVNLANGVAGLRISGGGDRAGVHYDDIGGCGVGCGDAAAITELPFEGGGVGLRRAAAELCNVKGRHVVVKMIAGRSGARKVLARGWRRAFVRRYSRAGSGQSSGRRSAFQRPGWLPGSWT